MAGGSDDLQIAQLIDAVQKLSASSEQVAAALLRLETLYVDMRRKQDEDRAEAKERQKEFDEEQIDFKARQKKWDERDDKWEKEDWWRKNPWIQPRELGYLLLMSAFAALAIAVCIMAAR